MEEVVIKNGLQLGLDLGDTIAESQGVNDHNVTDKQPFPDSFRVIKRCVEAFDRVFIVSKVNEEQKARAIAWLDFHRFYKQTGVYEEYVYWCSERKDKGPICKGLGIDIFVDDRPEVLLYMPDNVHGILFNPSDQDMTQPIPKCVRALVRNWKELEFLFSSWGFI